MLRTGIYKKTWVPWQWKQIFEWGELRKMLWLGGMGGIQVLLEFFGFDFLTVMSGYLNDVSTAASELAMFAGRNADGHRKSTVLLARQIPCCSTSGLSRGRCLLGSPLQRPSDVATSLGKRSTTNAALLPIHPFSPVR